MNSLKWIKLRDACPMREVVYYKVAEIEFSCTIRQNTNFYNKTSECKSQKKCPFVYWEENLKEKKNGNSKSLV